MIKFLTIGLLVVFLSCTDSNKQNDTDATQKQIVPQQEHKSTHQEEWEKNNKANTTDENSYANFNIKIESTETITDKNIASFNNPKFTPDGKNIVFTTNNYGELWIHNLESKKNEKLVNLPNCGYKFQISDDGKYLYFINRALNGKRSGGTYTIFQCNIENKNLDVIYKSSKRLSSQVVLNNTICLLEDDEPIVIDFNKRVVSNKVDIPFFYVKDNQLYKTFGASGSTKIESDEKFIDCNYSKDKKSIISLTAHNGIMLFDFEGKLINQFNNANDLTKVFNSNLVLFTDEMDDGQKIISSNMHIGFINSDKRISVDAINDFVFYPDWSPTDNKITYSTDDGLIKIISFNIEKMPND